MRSSSFCIGSALASRSACPWSSRFRQAARFHHPLEHDRMARVPGSPGRRDALDWAAEAVQRDGYAIAQAFVDAPKRGDWRASEALMNRIYGKPEEIVHRV